MLEHEIIISTLSSMLEQNSVITVIVSAMIGLSVALYVRYGIKPRIEKVFEKNRKSMLNGLLISTNQVSNLCDNAHRIFETQDNFEWREEMAYDLTVNQVEGLRFIRREIQRYPMANAKGVTPATMYIETAINAVASSTIR